MIHTVCLAGQGTAYDRLPDFIDEALQSFRIVAESLDLPVRYRVKVEFVKADPGARKSRQVDLDRRCWVHNQLHAETVSGTQPRRSPTS
jgi:hypothetical protein